MEKEAREGEEGNSKGTEMGLSIFKLGKRMKKKKKCSREKNKDCINLCIRTE